MFRPPLRLSLALTAAALVSSVATAGVITGTLIDSAGNPVRNAVFQVDAMAGSDTPIVSGGFTNANGQFTTTITPDGDYRITVFPLPPPQSSVVTARFENIVVGPTTNNLGVKVLEVGTALSGRVVNSVGTPLQQVSLEFLTAPDQQPLDFTNPDTSISGHFTVNIPFGDCEVHFEPGPVPYYGGTSTAPVTVFMNDVTGPVNLGDVVMPPGYSVSGVVRRRSDNTPVEDADVVILRSDTGASVWSPKDKTSETGSFLVVVPAGTYDFGVVADPDEELVAWVTRNRAVPPSLSLGTILLDEGVELAGKATDAGDVGQVGVTIRLTDSTTNQPVFTGSSRTTEGGSYRMTVPTGTFDLTFDPPYALPVGRETDVDLVVNGNLDHDCVLPTVPYYSISGTGTAGTGGVVPTISASGGTPRLGNDDYSLRVNQAVGGGRAFLLVSVGSGSAPVFGGGLARVHAVQLSGSAGAPGQGTASLAVGIGSSPALVGSTLRARAFVLDNGGAAGRAMTAELTATIAW